jgi:predicted HD phosphohydrolase
MPPAPLQSVEEVIDALERIDGQPSDDVVPALSHLLQTAELLEASHPDDVELVVAGLVHDLASALEPGCPDHGRAGARLVGDLLGDRVARLVAGHTDAKRYLVTVEPAYADGLSPNSTHTLVGQGGPMEPGEVASFEADPDRDALVALRRADDLAKVPGRPVRPPAAWRPALAAVRRT